MPSRLRLPPVAVALLISVSPALAETKFDLHAEGSVETTAYAQSIAQTNQVLETGRLALPATFKSGSEFKIKVEPVLQTDPLNHSPSERDWIDLPEGYLQWQSSGWLARAGYDTYAWGVTDGFNPLDVVSARRYQDALFPEKLGAPSLSLRKTIGPFSVQGIYIPWQRAGILPGENSRWLPRQILQSRSYQAGEEPVTILLPEDPSYSYAPGQELDRALENNVGARIEGMDVLPGLDVSLEAFEGSAPTPAVDVLLNGEATGVYPKVVIEADPGIELTPVYYRELVYGGTAVYANFGLIFRLEAAITRAISKRPDLPGDAEQYVLAVEHTFSSGTHGLTLLSELTYALHSVPPDNSTASLDRVFDRAAILGARYGISEKLTLTASGVWDTEFHSELGELEGAYSFNDTLKFRLRGLELWGAIDSPLGGYSDNARVQAALEFAL